MAVRLVAILRRGVIAIGLVTTLKLLSSRLGLRKPDLQNDMICQNLELSCMRVGLSSTAKPI